MRRRGALGLTVCVLLACGARPPPPPKPAPAPAPAAPAGDDVADLITADAIGVGRFAAGNVAILTAVEGLIAPVPPCWTHLVGQVRAAYQIEVGPGAAYHVFDGALPQDEVEACVHELRSLEPYVGHDGAVDEIIVRGGRLYLAWRGGLVIAASRRPLVEAALAVRSPTLAGTWRARLAALRPGAMAAWRSDAIITNLVGVRTVDYQIVVDFVGADPPGLAGAVVARFADPDAAALAAARLRAGAASSTLAPPPEVVAALQRLVITVRGAELEARFDERTFAGVDLAVLSAWMDRMAAGRP